jgi:hypothetical protein
MTTRRTLRSQQPTVDSEELIDIRDNEATQMEGICNSENGGGMEDVADYPCGQTMEIEAEIETQRSENEQTAGVDKGGKDSTVDMQAMFSSLMQRMDKFQENSESMKKELQESMRKDFQENSDSMRKDFRENSDSMEKRQERRMEKLQESMMNKFQEIDNRMEQLGKIEDTVQETRREMRASINRVATDLESKIDQRIQSVNDEVKTISERTDGQIQVLTETVHRDKAESYENVESLRSDVTAFQVQVTQQSEDVCERVSTCETRVTELKNITEQQQTKVSSDIEKINSKVTTECDKLKGQLDLLKSLNQRGSKGNSLNASSVMFGSRQTESSSGHVPEKLCVNLNEGSGNLDGEPHNHVVHNRGSEGGHPYGAPNNVVNLGMLSDHNDSGFVKGTLNNTLELILPTFEGLPDQNAQAHLDALVEYVQIKNVPPPLHLAVARRSLKGISVTTWGDAIWDQLRTFSDFRRIFLDRFWGLQCQAKVRLQIYQDKHDPRKTVSYCDHLMKYAVKAKYLEPQMSSFEFLNALKEHYNVGVRKAWIVAKPQTLQDAAAFLSDVAGIEESQEPMDRERPAYRGQRDDYHRPRSDPRDDHRGGWSRNVSWQNQRPAGRYEGGRDNRNPHWNQDWHGRNNNDVGNRNSNQDRDGNRRNQAATVSTPSSSAGNRTQQDRQAENRN